MSAVRRTLRAGWTPLVLILALVILHLVITTSGSAFYKDELERMFLIMIFVLGLQLFSGNSGILSFGHVALMAIGAYSSALLTIPSATKEATFTAMPHWLSSWIFPAELSPVLGMLVGAGFAALLAVVFAVPIARLAGVAAVIATLAVLIVVSGTISQTPTVTGGTNTMIGVPQTTTPTMTLIVLVLVLLGTFAFKQSGHGLRLQASRDDERAAMAVGIWVPYERFVAFALSGFVCGLAGALYAHYFIAFSYLDFYFPLTFLTIAMLVVGGLRSVTGAVVGTVFMTVIVVAVQRAEVNGVAGIDPPSGTANLVLALALLAALILRPDGITGGREIPWPRRRAKTLSPPASATS
jgi:branched-chain amino acid transport system permease protein